MDINDSLRYDVDHVAILTTTLTYLKFELSTRSFVFSCRLSECLVSGVEKLDSHMCGVRQAVEHEAFCCKVSGCNCSRKPFRDPESSCKLDN